MMTDCPRQQQNLAHCTCTYSACNIKGRCCECVARHRDRGELPGCFFLPEVERTYDRSRARYVKGHTDI